MTDHFSQVSRTVLVLAAVIIIIAGMKVSASLLVPFLLSVFIAVLSLPAMNALERFGLSAGVSLLTVIMGVFVAGLMLSLLIGNSIDEFSRSLPQYQQQITVYKNQVISRLAGIGVEIPESVGSDMLDPNAAMRLLSSIFRSFGSVLTNSFLIFITVIFILLEAKSFSKKFAQISDEKSQFVDDFVGKLNGYMGIKTWTSVITGVLVTLLLWSLGVDNARLWGVMAFLLNYVPNIGSIIAAVPAVLLALVQLGPGTALLAALGYLVINIVIGSVLEPRFMGKGLGLSTLVVFLSLVFWGWVLGPVGMLLSVPLTITVKLALDSKPETRWLGVLLGPA
ncbi:MAG: AI-2E family transporter [Gammaproteobacteria bacterium]|nr:AI-2E family transporter [Gammaproteobacteria bacterium]NNL07400.1 AI-2E family transporter [Gammaproteobacteria bacterium]